MRHDPPMGNMGDMLVAVLGLAIPLACAAIFLATVLPSFVFTCLDKLPKVALTLALVAPALVAGLFFFLTS